MNVVVRSHRSAVIQDIPLLLGGPHEPPSTPHCGGRDHPHASGRGQQRDGGAGERNKFTRNRIAHRFCPLRHIMCQLQGELQEGAPAECQGMLQVLLELPLVKLTEQCGAQDVLDHIWNVVVCKLIRFAVQQEVFQGHTLQGGREQGMDQAQRTVVLGGVVVGGDDACKDRVGGLEVVKIPVEKGI